MGYSYTTQDSGGDPGGYHQLKIFVYPDNSNDESICQNEVIPGLIDACEQAYSSSSRIDYWEVAYTEGHPGQWYAPGQDKREALDDFRNHLKGQSSVPTGAHLLVESNAAGGVADGGDHCDEETATEYERSAWFDWSPAVLGTEGYNSGLVRNLAIQEAFHNFIDNCIPGVYVKIDDDEHDLGQVYSNTWNDTVSPMLTTYVDGHQEHGDCQSGAWWDGDYTQTLTSCTKEALDETASYHGY